MIKIYTATQGSKVYIDGYNNGFWGAIGSGGVRETKTDKEGWAYLNFDDFGSSFRGKIVVNGRIIHQGTIDSNGTYRG